MSHLDYIEKQLNVIRFSADVYFDIAKFHGVLEYFIYEGLLTFEELDFFMHKALYFAKRPELYEKYLNNHESTEGADLPPN